VGQRRRPPFRFEGNLGQAGLETKYLARGNSFLLSLEGRGTTLKLRDSARRTRFLGANQRPVLDSSPLTSAEAAMTP
jgi:hypothetical protein